MFFKPLEQFELFFVNFYTNTWFDLILTNYFFTLIFVVFFLFFILLVLNENRKFVPSSLQFLFENLYIFVLKMMNEQIGSIAQRNLPFIITVFMFILLFNLFGLVPVTFTITAQIFTTFILGSTALIGITFLGLYNKHLKFFMLFVPKDVPVFLKPLLIFIEIISYVSRAFSLSIRLFANLMSGHTLLNILSSFCVKLFYSTVFFSFFPFIVIFLVFFLELGIALLQAYVFCVLFCIYLNDCY